MDLDKSALNGIFPVLPTPFAANGAVDAVALEGLVDFAMGAGVAGVVFPGFASESSELSATERSGLLAAVVRKVGGRVPVIAGASADTAAEVIDHGRAAQALGIDLLMVQPPKALGSSAEAVKNFFADVLGALPDVSIILQNAPAPRGSDLTPETIAQIATAFPQIAYVKEETLPAGPAISHLVAHGPDTLRGVIGGGGARLILDEYARGACAAMPALEIVDLHVDLDKAWRAGRRQEARRIYVDTLPLLTLQAIYRMRLTKHVLMRRGWLQETGVRAATPELDQDAIADIDANLHELGLLSEPMSANASVA